MTGGGGDPGTDASPPQEKYYSSTNIIVEEALSESGAIDRRVGRKGEIGGLKPC